MHIHEGARIAAVFLQRLGQIGLLRGGNLAVAGQLIDDLLRGILIGALELIGGGTQIAGERLHIQLAVAGAIARRRLRRRVGVSGGQRADVVAENHPRQHTND